MTVTAATSELGKTSEPADIVRTFLFALEAGRLDEALALLADDVEYTNVSMPTVRGRAGVERLVRPALEKLHLGFRLHCHTIATNGHTVLTERTDALILGRIEQRIWVYGRFDVVDGRITLWRDSFDWFRHARRPRARARGRPDPCVQPSLARRQFGNDGALVAETPRGAKSEGHT